MGSVFICGGNEPRPNVFPVFRIACGLRPYGRIIVGMVYGSLPHFIAVVEDNAVNQLLPLCPVKGPLCGIEEVGEEGGVGCQFRRRLSDPWNASGFLQKLATSFVWKIATRITLVVHPLPDMLQGETARCVDKPPSKPGPLLTGKDGSPMFSHHDADFGHQDGTTRK